MELDESQLEELEKLKSQLDQYFLVIMAVIIYFMQCGFAFLEAGSVRAKNTVNILMKNILDSAIGGVIYWTCGYAFAFGEKGNPFIGFSNFCLHNTSESKYAFFFFHFVFAATAATIVSGAMAERTQFVAYFIYSFVITGLVYPVVSHWAWSSSGWLGNHSPWPNVAYQDFAGSGVVHIVGGVAGLMGTAALGPRLQKSESGKRYRMQGHSVPIATFGAFILFFGFMAFNAGSQASISQPGDGAVLGRAAVNTVISGSGAALASMFVYYAATKKISITAITNGCLIGMVSICAGCNVLTLFGSLSTGVISGVTLHFWSELVFKLGFDDPLDAFAVHFGGGLWGVASVCLLDSQNGLLYSSDPIFSIKKVTWNLIGAVCISIWTAAITGPLFFCLDQLNGLRVSEEVEERGLDLVEHGRGAYPAEAFSSRHLYNSLLETISKEVELIKQRKLSETQTTAMSDMGGSKVHAD